MAARMVGSSPAPGSGQPDERVDIFLSYGPGEVIGESDPIYEALHKKFGARVVRRHEWMVDGTAQLRTCRVLVPVLELAGVGFARLDNAADPLRQELELARNEGIAILPVLVGDAAAEPVPELLKLPPAQKPVRFSEQSLGPGLRELNSRLEKILQHRAKPKSLRASIADPSALLLAVTFAILNYLLGAAPWTAAGVGLGVLLVWVVADVWLVPRLLRT